MYRCRYADVRVVSVSVGQYEVLTIILSQQRRAATDTAQSVITETLHQPAPAPVGILTSGVTATTLLTKPLIINDLCGQVSQFHAYFPRPSCIVS